MSVKVILATVMLLADLAAGSRPTFHHNLATGSIDVYSNKKRIGAGGMGTIYSATAPDGKLVVIKEAKHGVYRAAEILREEAASMKAVKGCPHIVNFVEASEGEQAPFLVMSPFSPDGDLQRAKSQTSTNDWFKYVQQHKESGADPDGAYGPLKRVLLQIAEALACFADRGLVYSDLKADNILIAPGESPAATRKWFDLVSPGPEGAPGREVLITDFGLTFKLSESDGLRAAGSQGTLHKFKTRDCAGTTTWQAPECLRQKGIYEGYVWSYDIFGFGAMSLALAGVQLPDWRKSAQDVYDFWCDTLANPTHLDEEVLATDERPFADDFVSRVGISDRCLREAIIRSLALDPTQRISPVDLVSLLNAVGDETRCRAKLETLPRPTVVVPADMCKGLFHTEDSLVDALHGSFENESEPKESFEKAPQELKCCSSLPPIQRYKAMVEDKSCKADC